MGKQKVVKDFDELEFRDDFMFGKVMEDRDLCRGVLECLLQEPVGELEEVQTQKEFRYTVDGKPIRLDVYNRDSEGIVYDAEMQNLNNKSLEFHQLPKRSRFYQSAIDIDFMDKGSSYRDLPESKVIFMCTFDPFMRGESRYTFGECCREVNGLELEDGTEKIFFNCTYEGEDIPDRCKKLYDYIENGSVTDVLTGKIHEAVIRGRKNQAWRGQYMKERIIRMDMYDEGREDEREEMIFDMLKRGKTVDEIVDFCGYPYELVERVEKNMLASVE